MGWPFPRVAASGRPHGFALMLRATRVPSDHQPVAARFSNLRSIHGRSFCKPARLTYSIHPNLLCHPYLSSARMTNNMLWSVGMTDGQRPIICMLQNAWVLAWLIESINNVRLFVLFNGISPFQLLAHY